MAPERADLATPRAYSSRLQADTERFFLSREVPGEANSLSHIERAAPACAGHALYHLRPVTGQRHQLRLHMLALGAPILGDAFYPTVLRAPGDADDTARPLQLLARQLAFDDPLTGQRRSFQSLRTLKAAADGAGWPPNEHTASGAAQA